MAREGTTRALLVLGALIIAVVAYESIARVTSLGPPRYAPRRIDPEGAAPFARSPAGLPYYEPHAAFAHVYDVARDTLGHLGASGRVMYRMNAFGMRGGPVTIAKPDTVFRVLCVGDSFTFGEGVAVDDAYPAVLQTLLSPRPDGTVVEVLNAGVQGYGVEEVVAYVDNVGRRFEPDVIVYGFYLNDLVNPATTIAQLAERTTASGSRLAQYLVSWRLVQHATSGRRREREMLDDIRRSFDATGWTRIEAAFERLAVLAERSASRVIVAIFPVLRQLDERYAFSDIHAEIARAATAHGFLAVDLLDALRTPHADRLWVHPTDPHPNPTAHRRVAGALAGALAAP